MNQLLWKCIAYNTNQYIYIYKSMNSYYYQLNKKSKIFFFFFWVEKQSKILDESLIYLFSWASIWNIYLESSQSIKLNDLSSRSMSFEGSLEETPVPKLENNFGRSSINAKYFPCKPTRKSRSKYIMRWFKALFLCFVVLKLLWQWILQQRIVAPNS